MVYKLLTESGPAGNIIKGLESNILLTDFNLVYRIFKNADNGSPIKVRAVHNTKEKPIIAPDILESEFFGFSTYGINKSSADGFNDTLERFNKDFEKDMVAHHMSPEYACRFSAVLSDIFRNSITEFPAGYCTIDSMINIFLLYSQNASHALIETEKGALSLGAPLDLKDDCEKRLAKFKNTNKQTHINDLFLYTNKADSRQYQR